MKSSFYAQTGPTYQGDNPASSSNEGEINASFPSPAAADAVDIPVLFACTLTSNTIVGDVVGNAVFDILAAPLGTVPTTSICAGALPTLTAAQFSQDLTLTGWTTIVPANTVLRIKLNSVSGLARVALALKLIKG